MRYIKFQNEKRKWVRGGPYENIEKIENVISEIFKMLGYDLTFLTYKWPNLGGFK